MKLAKDKQLHILAGAIAALGAVWLVVIERHLGLPAAALASATAVGWGYELVQKYRGEGHPSKKDALATMFGGAIVSAVIALALLLTS